MAEIIGMDGEFRNELWETSGKGRVRERLAQEGITD